MGSKTRLGSYCTKRANNGVNLVTSRYINTRLARPIGLPNAEISDNRNRPQAGYDLALYPRLHDIGPT